MDRRPIGVFDSGFGGLTAVRELARIMPEEDLIYFGDTGRVPYGGRSKDILVKYARQDVAFLRTFNPKAIVIACGTVSTTALDVLQAENELPIVGVVEPTCRRCAPPRTSPPKPAPCWSPWWRTGGSAPAILWRRRWWPNT